MPAKGARVKQAAKVKPKGGVMGSAAKMAQRQASALSKKRGSKGKFKDDLDSDADEVEADEEEEAEEEEEEEAEEEEEEEEEVEVVEKVIEKVIAKSRDKAKVRDKVQSSDSKVLTIFIFFRTRLSTDKYFCIGGGRSCIGDFRTVCKIGRSEK
jgi:serine phosphatase RsbU (regulator of sigma subunit)